MIDWLARGDTAALETRLRCRFNGDSTNKYAWTNLLGQASSSSDQTSGTTLVGLIQAGSVAASLVVDTNEFSSGRIYIPAYKAGFYKYAFGQCSIPRGTNVNSHQLRDFSGEWQNTAAITQVTLSPTAGNFVSGTRVTLWGM